MIPTQFWGKGKQYFTKTELKARGWSENLINELLVPDIVSTNPYNPKGPPIRRFLTNRVHVAESDPRFLRHIEQREARGVRPAVKGFRNDVLD